MLKLRFCNRREDSRIIIALSTALHAMLKASVFPLPEDEEITARVLGEDINCLITLTIADTCYMMQVPLFEVC